MYNAENYIGNCIESILQQNIAEQDYEIIIMDDGSRDNSIAIVCDFTKRHKNIRLYTESNVGTYSTRNKLLKIARGDYIYNLDSDDYIVHNCLGDLIKIAEDNCLDIIGFKTKATLALDQFKLNDTIEAYKVEISSGKAFIVNYKNLRYEVWWYLIRKDFMENNNMSFNNNEYNADVIFTLEALLKAEKIGYLPLSIHRYVQTQDSLMRSMNIDIIRKRFEFMQMMINNTSQLINSLKQDSNSGVLIKNMSYRRDVFTLFIIINMVRNPFSLEYIKNIIKTFKATGAYPINYLKNYKYGGLKFRLLVAIVNNEKLIYTLTSIKNLFSKPIN